MMWSLIVTMPPGGTFSEDKLRYIVDFGVKPRYIVTCKKVDPSEHDTSTQCWYKIVPTLGY